MSFLKFAERNPDAAQAALERAGNKIAALRARGICTHGWIMAPAGSPIKCLDCGAVFADHAEHGRAMRKARGS